MPEDTGAESGPGQFLPRIGVAYRWNDKTVIRGGYGQSADPRPFIDFRNAYPVVNLFAMPTPTFNGTTNSFLPATTLRQGLINRTLPDLRRRAELPSNTARRLPGRRCGRRITFTFIVERQLPMRFTTSVATSARARQARGGHHINAGAPGKGTRPPLFTTTRRATPSITAESTRFTVQTVTFDSLQRRSTPWTSSLLGLDYTTRRR